MKKRRDALYISLLLIFLLLLLIGDDIFKMTKGLAKWQEVWWQDFVPSVLTGMVILILRIPIVQRWLELR